MQRLAMLAHRGSDSGAHVRDDVGFACRWSRIAPESARERQPLVDTGSMVAFDGRLDNRPELLAALRRESDLSADSPDPVIVLAAYRAYGDSCIERLNGDFALAIADTSARRLLLVRDAVGVRPLNYYAAPGLLIFASEIKAILADARVPRRPNEAALADYLLTRFTMGDHRGDTFFEGIHSVPPGHVTIVTPAAVSTRQYWKFDLERTTRVSSFREHAEGFRACFEQAVRRRMRRSGPIAVSVSGGLDSSSIFCTAQTLRRRAPREMPDVIGFSCGAPCGSPADESAFLAEIERRYGVQIHRVFNLPSGFIDGSARAIWHTEAPLLDGQWARTHALLAAVHDSGCRVLLTGHWGDQVTFDDGYLLDLWRRAAWREAWTHATEHPRWLGIADPRFSKRRLMRSIVREYLPDAIVPTLRRVRNFARPARGPLAWYTNGFRQRASAVAAAPTRGRRVRAHAHSLAQEVTSRYHVLCMEWNGDIAAMHGLEMAFPFLDRDLIEFVIATPGEVLTWQGVPKAILRSAMDDVLPDSIAQRRSKADFTDVVNDGVALDYESVVEYLRRGRLAARWGIVDAKVMDEQLAAIKVRVRGPDCAISWALADLLALELWLRQFFAVPE